MIFNCVLINLHKNKNIYTSFFVLFITVPKFGLYFILYSFFLSPLFSHFLLNSEVGLKFRRLSFIGCYITNMLLKSSAFIRSLNMHLYQNKGDRSKLSYGIDGQKAYN